MSDDLRRSTVEHQWIRENGTVIISFVTPAEAPIYWEPAPWERIYGSCSRRARVLPDGQWQILAEFPDGYPERGDTNVR